MIRAGRVPAIGVSFAGEFGSFCPIAIFREYRLITAIHYNLVKVFVLRFMTHAEYSKDRWKDEL